MDKDGLNNKDNANVNSTIEVEVTENIPEKKKRGRKKGSKNISTQKSAPLIANDIGETSFDALSNDKYCVCWTSESKWRKKFREWYKDHKDECGRFIDDGEFRGATVTLEIPKKCMEYIRFPRIKEMSEEDRNKISDRMKKAWAENSNFNQKKSKD